MNTPRRTGNLGCAGGCLLVVLPVAFVAGLLLLLWMNPVWFDELAFWRGPTYPEDVLDPPPPPAAPVPFALRQATLPLDNDPTFPLNLSGLAEVERTSRVITAAQGGEVRLADGAGVIIPPGALPGDRTVTVRRLGGADPAMAMLSVLDVDAGGSPLNSDATVLLPVPQGLPALARLPKSVKILYVHGGRAAEIPSTHGPGVGFVTARTRQFSLLIGVLIAGLEELWYLNSRLWEETLNQYVEDRRCDPPLRVPYYSQGNSNWCYAAALSMLVRSHGGSAAMPEIASHFRGDYLTAMNNAQGYWFGQLETVLAVYQPELSRVPWFDPGAVSLYICRNLAEGRPVYVDIFKIQHGVVAVGFNERGIYIHDPSGTALVYAGFTDVRRRIDDGRLGAVFIPWERFFEICSSYRRLLPPVSKPIYTCVFKAPRSATAVSVEVLHDSLAFIHPTPAPFPKIAPWISNYAWDGRHYHGDMFQLNKQDPFWDDRGKFLRSASIQGTPSHPCNGDKYSLRAIVSYPQPAPGPISVRAFLDDQPLGPAKAVQLPPVLSEPHRVNVKVDLTPIDGSPLPVRLDPGPADLRVEVYVGGVRTDYQNVRAHFGPSQVAGLRFVTQADGVDLEWDPVPERGVTYHVRLVEKVLSFGTEQVKTRSCRWRVPAELFDKKDRCWLYVQAVHDDTDLEGVPSDYLALRDPWEGEWSGKITLAEGTLFESGDLLMERYKTFLLDNEKKDQQNLEARLKTATGTEADGIRKQITAHQESNRQYTELLNSVKNYLSSVLLLVDMGARTGVPVTFELRRTTPDQYDLRLRKVVLKLETSVQPVKTVTAGPHTLAFAGLESAMEQGGTTPLRINPPPRLRLHRWNEARGDTIISCTAEGKLHYLLLRWNFTRKPLP